MSLGYAIAIRAIPFFELIEAEELRLAEEVREAEGPATEAAAMDSSRQRLSQGIDAFIRSLPSVVRHDVNASRDAAYALVGLADERILHHPAGGLERWRERLLEYDLYSSALAGQEIVNKARAASYGTVAESEAEEVGGAGLLAPLYLAVFRAGFEGSLRGDTASQATLTSSLADAVGAGRERGLSLATGVKPLRIGFPVLPMAVASVIAWLAAGFLIWLVLTYSTLDRADQAAQRLATDLPITTTRNPLERSVGPSGLTPLGQSPGDDLDD